ncbi:MAG TPA: sigma-70 family RNA polymerase sigma factor [Gaiellales bacterium]|nr:sigma-70 family RNA polymerase sigma factor [Gaiellales bacterium]
MGSEHPTSFAALREKSDADLVAHARKYYAEGEAGLETAKRCVAIVFERHRMLVRSVCAAKAPIDVVDDLESDVYVRFVRAVYLGAARIESPSGLLVVMARRVVASFHDGRKPADAPLDDLAEVPVDEDGYNEIASREVVEQLLSVLNERQRSVVWGRLWGGMSGAEIAGWLDISRRNVDVIFFRAMERMGKELRG